MLKYTPKILKWLNYKPNITLQYLSHEHSPIICCKKESQQFTDQMQYKVLLPSSTKHI